MWSVRFDETNRGVTCFRAGLKDQQRLATDDSLLIGKECLPDSDLRTLVEGSLDPLYVLPMARTSLPECCATARAGDAKGHPATTASGFPREAASHWRAPRTADVSPAGAHR